MKLKTYINFLVGRYKTFYIKGKKRLQRGAINDLVTRQFPKYGKILRLDFATDEEPQGKGEAFLYAEMSRNNAEMSDANLHNHVKIAGLEVDRCHMKVKNTAKLFANVKL